jgi:hypothetical protein
VRSILNSASHYYNSHHSLLIKCFSQMAFPLKQVRTLEEQLRISEEVQKNPSEKRTDVAKQLGLPPSTLNTIIANEKTREHAYVCGPGAHNVWCAVWKKCGELGSGSRVEEVQGGGGGDDDSEAEFYGSTSCI